jgi:hypothetical protein
VVNTILAHGASIFADCLTLNEWVEDRILVKQLTVPLIILPLSEFEFWHSFQTQQQLILVVSNNKYIHSHCLWTLSLSPVLRQMKDGLWHSPSNTLTDISTRKLHSVSMAEHSSVNGGHCYPNFTVSLSAALWLTDSSTKVALHFSGWTEFR